MTKADTVAEAVLRSHGASQVGKQSTPSYLPRVNVYLPEIVNWLASNFRQVDVLRVASNLEQAACPPDLSLHLPHVDDYESKLSVNARMWSAKNGISKFSWICLLLTYQVALFGMRRHFDWNVCSFWTVDSRYDTRNIKKHLWNSTYNHH